MHHKHNFLWFPAKKYISYFYYLNYDYNYCCYYGGLILYSCFNYITKNVMHILPYNIENCLACNLLWVSSTSNSFSLWRVLTMFSKKLLYKLPFPIHVTKMIGKNQFWTHLTVRCCSILFYKHMPKSSKMFTMYIATYWCLIPTKTCSWPQKILSICTLEIRRTQCCGRSLKIVVIFGNRFHGQVGYMLKIVEAVQNCTLYIKNVVSRKK